jgi:hypothetical protein
MNHTHVFQVMEYEDIGSPFVEQWLTEWADRSAAVAEANRLLAIGIRGRRFRVDLITFSDGAFLCREPIHFA